MKISAFANRKSMAYLRMTLRNAIFMALFFTAYVSAMTETAESYAEQAAYSLADVAHIRQFEWAIHPSTPEWYCKGMRIFAFEDLGIRWDKKDLTWGIMNAPTFMSEETVIKTLKAAFRKWAKHSPFTFTNVPPNPMPDIRIYFIPNEEKFVAQTVYNRFFSVLDDVGIAIRFADTKRWVDRSLENWRNFEFVAMLEIGHVLGLGDSKNRDAVMFRDGLDRHRGDRSIQDYGLQRDEIDGIRAKYGNPSTWRRKPRTRPSSSSSEDDISRSEYRRSMYFSDKSHAD